MKTIWDLIADVRLSPSQTAYIVDAEQRVVAHRGSVGGVARHTLCRAWAGWRPAGAEPLHGVVAVSTVRLGGQSLHIVVEQEWSEALALAISTARITLILVFAMLLISGALGFLSVRQIVRPIQTLAAAAEAMSAGDLSQQVHVARRDELGVLRRLQQHDGAVAGPGQRAGGARGRAHRQLADGQ